MIPINNSVSKIQKTGVGYKTETICYEAGIHHNHPVIWMRFEYNQALIAKVRQLGAKWSQTQKCWYLPELTENPVLPEQQLMPPYPVGIISKAKQFGHTPANKKNTTDIHAVNGHILPALRQQLILKAYSASTIKTYCNEIAVYLSALKHEAADDFPVKRIKGYLQYCFEVLKLSENTLHSRINALKFYYEQVLGREKFFWEIPRPKKPQQLPRVFNQDEVAAIINSLQNKKHKTMLMVAYSAGLRVSEVVSLKTSDIDSKRMTILIRQAKGKKDRMAGLSPVLLVMLREYALQYKPAKGGYLFEGSAKDSPYSTRSLQEVIKMAKDRAGIIRPGSIHSLRHSFATHLADRGTDISMIQKLLGHNDIKTTLRYLHTSNKDLLKIASPLDDLHLT
jgi:integrase/recombinase XerD